MGALLLCAAGCGSIARWLPAAAPDAVLVQTLTRGQDGAPSTTVASARTARELYGLIRALPPWPQPAPLCPADLGPHYRLTFMEGGRAIVTVIADPGGCPMVSLPGGHLGWARNGTGAAIFGLLAASR